MDKLDISLSLIGIDGDDTLWYSEIVYERLYGRVKSLFSDAFTWDDRAFSQLLHSNIGIIGYGMKTYCISLLEYLISMTSNDQLFQVIQLTKNTWNEPIELYRYAKEIVSQMSTTHRTVLVTQGDTAEQSSKISRCGIEFDDVEIIAQKKEQAYLDMLEQRNVSPSHFIMIGNSFKSDILPVLNIGAKAIYIKSRWQFERVDDTLMHPNLYRCDDLRECIQVIKMIEDERSREIQDS